MSVGEEQMAPGSIATPWRVAPASGFCTLDDSGDVGLIQINATEFLVVNGFSFAGAAADDIERRLVADGVDPADARARIDEARTFEPDEENPTDLASIPPFMRWFENSYGLHTLAAILHDDQIQSEPNSGSLGSDALADRFFREMLRAAGVLWLKRWIMWSAVALRSRWVAGGLRRFMLASWVVLAVLGISSFVLSVGAWAGIWDPGIGPGILALIAIALPLVSAPLWGAQIGAGLIATVAALWIVPAAGFAIVGLGVYRVLERIAGALGLD